MFQDDLDGNSIFNNNSQDHNNAYGYQYEHHGEGERGWGWDWGWEVALQVFYCLVCIVGLAGNTLVIYVILRFSKIPTVTNFYLVNLAIADLLFLIGVPFLVATMNLGYWPFGKIVCKVYYYFTSINQISSSMFLLVMSADRYLAVCHPIRSIEWRTPLISKLVAFVAWTLSALVMFPIFYYADTLEFQTRPNCNIFWPEYLEISGAKIFVFYSFFLGFCLPFTLIFVFYVLIIRRIWAPAAAVAVGTDDGVGVGVGESSKIEEITSLNNEPFRNSSSDPDAGPSLERVRNRQNCRLKVTKLVLAIITVYFVCWFPFWLTQIDLVLLTESDEPHSHAKQIVFLLTGCLSYSNSAVNPILYAFLSHNFKTDFLKACPLLFKNRNRNSSENESRGRRRRLIVPSDEGSMLTDEALVANQGGVHVTAL